MYVIEMKNIRKAIKNEMNAFRFTLDEREYRIELSWQKTGYGKRCFLVCPFCGDRYIRLYIDNGRIKCYKCAEIKQYYPIQYTTKGGHSELEYRMQKYGMKNDIKVAFPFDYRLFINDKRINRESFKKKLLILQALENMRFQAIMFNITYKAKTINDVVKNNHPLLAEHSLMELKDYLYSW